MTNNKLVTPIIVIATIVVALFAWISLGPTTSNKPDKKVTVAASDIPVGVISVAERVFDNKPAIAVLMSSPLDPKLRYDKYLKISKKSPQGFQKAVGGWVLSDNGRVLYYPHISPQTRYDINVLSGLPAANKSIIRTQKDYTIVTRKVTPYYAFAGKGSILPTRSNDGLPIVTVNFKEVQIQFLRIAPKYISQFLHKYKNNGKIGHPALNRLRIQKLASVVYTGRYRTMGKPNQRTTTNVPVHQTKQLKQPGLYLALLSSPGHFNYYHFKSTYFMVTDIGLHARLYQGGLHVYATSLNSGKQLTNAKVKVYNRYGHITEQSIADAQGIAKFQLTPSTRSTIIAERGKEIAVLSFKDPALDLSEFKIRGLRQKPLETFVYSNRDLFRPGEHVNFSILLRDQDGKKSKQMPLHIKVKRPDGRVMRKFSLQGQKKGTLGYYYHRYAIPKSGQAGKWSLEVRINPADKTPSHTYKFNVEEFLPERMKLDLASTRDFLTPSEVFTINLDGAYLYGAPAAGNRVKAVLNRFPQHHPLPDRPKFYFGDVNESKNRTRTEFLDSKLGKDGKYVITVKPEKVKHHSPFTARVTASIFESGGRPVTRSIKRVVWPAKTLIGVKPLYSGKVAEENTTVEFEVIKVFPNGKRLAASNLDVKLIREDRNYYWSYSAQRGWHYEFSQDEYPVIVRSINLSADQNGKIALPVKYGSYRLEITDPATQLIMRHRFFAGYNWSQRSQASNARPNAVNLTLHNTKPGMKGFRAGDTAKLKIVAPHAGRAVVTIESNKLLWRKSFNISAKGKEIDFKISSEWANRHDLYVSAIVYRPGQRSERLTPNRAIGVVHLPLDREHRKLAISLDMPKKMQPGRDLVVKVKVANLHNQKALITLSAVDLGILNITDFPTPDPFGFFFAKRSYDVRQYDAFHKVIENKAGVRARLRFGGDAPGKQSKKADAKVKTVALFSGAVDIDDKGEATIKLKVPDYNGSLRVMAVAFSQDRFGSNEGKVIVAAPVIAEIATPRFISPGDQSTLTMDLHNLSGEDQNLQVELQVTSPLQLKHFKKTIALANKKKQVLRLPLSALENFGVGKIFLTVKGKGVDLKRSWELGVRPAFPGLRRVAYKVVKPGEPFVLDKYLHQDLMAGTVDGTLVVSTVPPLNVRGAVKGLLQYPYGCLEQTTSRVFPIVYINEQKALSLGLKPFTDAKRSKLVKQALTHIRSMQLTSGGFGLWNNRSPEEPWLTPYVVHFMLEARAQGYDVPEDMLKKALTNVENRLNNGHRAISQQFYSRNVNYLFFASKAYSAYVLARVQRASLGTIRQLYHNQIKNSKDIESGLPLVQLGIALKLMGDTKTGMEAIKMGVVKVRKSNRYLGDYGSVIRDTGMMISLIHQHKLDIPGADKLLFSLATTMKTRTYLSTQEQLAVFMASNSLSKFSGHSWQGTIKSHGKSTPIKRKGRYINAFNAAQLDTGVQLSVNSKDPLYAMYVVTGYPKKAPDPITVHINASRTLYDMKGNPVVGDTFKVGQLLIAHISVRSTQRTDNALIVDLLPAGFEIENLNLSKGEDLSKIRIQGKNPKAVMNNKNIVHQEYRDDRFAAAVKLRRFGTTDLFYLVRVVSPGTYSVPPVLVEDMYRPDWRGIGKTAKKITVINVSH